MTDPYPEARRRGRLDRTDHARAARDRRARDRGPSNRDIRRALDDVADHDVPGTPSVGSLQILRYIDPCERTAGSRTIRDMKVVEGDPVHGERRSDTHVGRYEVEVPFSEIDDACVAADACTDCGHDVALYKYHAHHFIAGGESVWCPQCEAQHYSEEWG